VSATVGRPLPRVDGRAKVTGAARYAAEFAPAGLVHATLVKATIGRGRVTAIDAGAALAAPGVLAVLTHENVSGLKTHPDTGAFPGEERIPLCDDRVHYAGQDVAVVVAEGFEQARHAASLVRVAYAEEEPRLPDLENIEALHPEPGRDTAQHHRGDVDAALADPGVVRMDATYLIPEETHNPMEPSATVAEWHDGKLTVHDATQWVKGTMRSLAEVFGLGEGDVRVICPYVGGGFGCKGAEWPHTTLAAVAARAVGRPVKLVLTRPQMFDSTGHRPPLVQDVTLGARPDGALTAIRHRTICVSAETTDFLEQCGRSTSRVMYASPNADVTHEIARANVPPGTFMRGPGETPGTFAVESAMDELALAVGLDPLELRRINHTDTDPSTGRPWSSKHLLACYERGADRFGWAGRPLEAGQLRDGDDLVGWGMATAVFPALRNAASARVTVGPDGRARVRTASHDLGTGAYTVFTQVAADALGLPADRVDVEIGDSALPNAPVAGGSGSSASVGEAVAGAGVRARAEVLHRLRVTGDAPLSHVDLADLDEPVGVELDSAPDPEVRNAYGFLSFGAHFVEVRIDPALPRVRVTRTVSVMDVGRVLNPRTATSQIRGSVVMGIGMALMEHTIPDPRTGRAVNDNLADYAVPVNPDTPAMAVEFIDEPDPQMGPLGVRGVGEIGITGLAAAVANAVWHATGRRVRELPITPEKLL
jgi:xanthine dehydrogenase YagR molybdenum-binding subunit